MPAGAVAKTFVDPCRRCDCSSSSGRYPVAIQRVTTEFTYRIAG